MERDETSQLREQPWPSSCSPFGPYPLWNRKQPAMDAFFRRLATPLNTASSAAIRADTRSLLARYDRMNATQRAALTRSTADLAEMQAKVGALDVREATIYVRRLSTTIQHLSAPRGSLYLSEGALGMAYVSVDVAARVTHACDDFVELAKERAIDFQIDVPDAIEAELDRGKFDIIIATLLFGAFKQAPIGGRIRCRVVLDGEDDLVLAVEDDGPPVEIGVVNAIFDRRSEVGRAAPFTAQGLTLSLGTARDLVALHGGTLDLAPTLDADDKGTVFEASFPRTAPRGTTVHVGAVAQGSIARSAAVEARAELLAEARIDTMSGGADARPLALIVTGSRSLARMVVHTLSPDCRTLAALDSTAGLKRGLDARPDLIILDLATIEGTHEELIASIRHGDKFDGVAILTLATGDAARFPRALVQGLEDVICAPVGSAELRTRACRLLVAKKIARETRTTTDLPTPSTDGHGTRGGMRIVADPTTSHLLRVMSHELKTPVTALLLQVSVLQGPSKATLPARVQQGLERITRSSRRLLHLVDSLLEWARLDAGRFTMTVEPINVAELCHRITREMAGHAQAKSIELVVSPNESSTLVLQNDSRVVRLLLVSLIEHAIHVTDKGVVEIRHEVDATGSRIRVRDGSSSMNHEQRHEMLGSVREIEVTNGHSGAGSGLGLRIVLDLARALGGDLQWEYEDPQSNVFVLSLTQASAPSFADSASAALSAEASPSVAASSAK